MSDILLGLLELVLEPLFDAIFEYLLAALADLLLRSLGEVFEDPRIQSPVLAYVGYALWTRARLHQLGACSPSSCTSLKNSWPQFAHQSSHHGIDAVWNWTHLATAR